MILSQLLTTFRDLAYNHTQIEGFYTGLVEEHNDALIQYPALRISFPYQAAVSQDDDVLSYTIDFTLLVNDVIEDVGNEITGPSEYEVNTNYSIQQDELNEIDADLVDENLLRERAISIMAQYVQGLRNLEEEPQYFNITDGWSIQSLERYGNDSVTGCKVTLTISVGNDYKCQSIANVNQSVWRDSTMNHIALNAYECPDCPPIIPFPTDCNDLLAALSVSQLNDCILPTYDFSDIVVQNATTIPQQDDMTTWLCPAPSPQYTILQDGVNEYSRLYHDVATSFHSSDPFSIGGWMRTATVGGVQTIIAKKVGTTTAGYTMFMVGGSLHMYLIGNASNYIRVQTNGYVFNLNTFYHVGFSYDGSSTAAGVTLYVNGVAVAMTVLNDNLGAFDIYNISDIVIGAEFGWGYFFRGYLGYQRIWNMELAASDFLDEYNGGSMLREAIQPGTLVLDWRSGEGAIYYSNAWFFKEIQTTLDTTQGFTVSMEYTDRTIILP